MFKIATKIIMSMLVVATVLAVAPQAFAQRSFHSNRTEPNRDMHNMRNYDRDDWRIRHHDRDNWRFRHFDRDRLFRNRFFRNNTVFLGAPYNYYAPFVYYERNLPYTAYASTIVIVDRDNPSNVMVLGNTSYSGSSYDNIIVLRVSDAVYWRIYNAVNANDLDDFRYDRDRDWLMFRDRMGDYSTSDIMSNMMY